MVHVFLATVVVLSCFWQVPCCFWQVASCVLQAVSVAGACSRRRPCVCVTLPRKAASVGGACAPAEGGRTVVVVVQELTFATPSGEPAACVPRPS